MSEACRICLETIKVEPELEPNKLKLEISSEQDITITDNPVACNKCKKEIDAVYELHLPSVKEELVTENIKTEEIVDDDLILFSTDIPLYNEESISVNNFYNCSQCNYVTNDKNDLTDHVFTHRFNCDQCGYTTSDNNLLINHERIHRTTGYLQCNVCDYICTESHSLDEHLLSHIDVRLDDTNRQRLQTIKRSFECYDCGYKAISKSTLKFHMRTHKETARFSCKACGFDAHSKNALKSHVHSQQMFSNKSKLIKSEKGGRLFSCNMCDYETNRKARLNEHKFVHSEEKPFKCRVCDYGCKSSKTLKTHLSKHLGERAYGCDHKTYTNYELQYHKRIHSDEKVFKCSLCDYGCNFSSNLKTHLRKHLDEPSYGYSCDKCNFKTYAKSLLQRHKIVDSDEKP